MRDRTMIPAPPRHAERGYAMFFAVLMSVCLIGLGTVLLTAVTATTREHEASAEHMRRLYIAEAGVQAAVLSLTTGGNGNVGNALGYQPFDTGAYWATTVNNGNQTYTTVAHGRLNGQERVVEAVVSETGHVFYHAVFAGNSAGDPNYTMTFEGSGTQADRINGDVYSGGNVKVAGNALVNGQIRADGTITGNQTGAQGVTQPIPDIAGMHYETNHDVDVKQAFTTAVQKASAIGGTAWELPQTNPAHIFRKNPTDRATECASTGKDDYFLEDPYEPVRTDAAQNGTDACPISFDLGVATPNVRRVYYIDGNLWIHNCHTYSFKFKSPGAGGLQVTFVIKGNLYISDNTFLDNRTLDGVAFVAIKDAAVADSGNVYFGDPRFGTLLSMDGFLYAEHDFKDINLSANGSKNVTLNGTMSAGNQVAIQRTVGTQHSKLTVNYDPRMKSGGLKLPGVPAAKQQLKYSVVAWREISPYHQ